MGIPDGFGRQYRRALFALMTRRRAIVLGFVLLDEAYTYKTTTIEAGQRYLAGETLLDRRDLRLARDDLVAADLLEYHSEGVGRKARSRWTLLIPENVERGKRHPRLVGGSVTPTDAADTGGDTGVETGISAGGASPPRFRSVPVPTSSCPTSRDQPGQEEDSDTSNDELTEEQIATLETGNEFARKIAKAVRKKQAVAPRTP